MTDVSASPENYNEFTLDEDELSMMTGDYEYRAYQMPDGGSEDESIGLLVEIGKARVVLPTITPVAYKRTQTQTKGYERQ